MKDIIEFIIICVSRLFWSAYTDRIVDIAIYHFLGW